MVLQEDRVVSINESIIIQNKQTNFISVKAPLHHDGNIIGVCGVSIVNEGYHFTDLLSVLGIISTLFQEEITPKLVATNQPSRIPLTSREKDCLYLYMKGGTTKNIANVLGLSNRTVEYYIANIKSKWGVSKRSELLQIAFNLYSDLL